MATRDPVLEQVVEAAPNANVVVDGGGTIVLTNAAAERLFGYPRAELIGQPVDLLVPERVRARHAGLVAGFAAAPRARAMDAGLDLTARRKDGTEVPVEIGLSPIDSPLGPLTLASIVDISARRRAEELAARVVEAAPSAIVVIDAARRIRLVNAKTEELFGYGRDELVGRLVEDLIPERLRAAHAAHVAGYLAAPSTRAMGAGRELHALRKDGSEVVVEIGLSPLSTPDGTLALASIVDVTERRRVDDELRRSNVELEQFAYVASHDLQEPLRMVASYTELLGERYRGQLDERADRYIHYAVDGARRMQRLVSDLLTYSRVGSQGRPLVATSAAAAVRKVLADLQVAIAEAGATVDVGELPDVLADEGQLRQLFQNLLTNALRFRGERPLHVRIAAEAQDGKLRFSVADNGIGLEMQYAERIFQMFQRLHERGRYEGSGIGLAIAKRIVERHGGRISVDAAPDRGATFSFTLSPVPRGHR